VKHVVVFLVSMSLLVAAVPAGAQIEKGDKELQANLFLFTVSGVTLINTSASLGYFSSEQLEYGGGPNISYISGPGFSDTTVGLMLFGRYHFTTTSKTVPYLCGQWYQFDLAPGDEVDFVDMSYLQFGGGFKYFLSEDFAFDMSGEFGFSLGGGDISFMSVAGFSRVF
jgi:hypothetical protein